MIETETGNDSVRLAYNRIAHDYDIQVDGDAWMRAILWREYARIFQPGDHVLDVSCGTGLDAVFLARAGIRVTGIDISSEMVTRLRARVAAERLEALVDSRVMNSAEIECLPEGEFDGIISAFAGLNTSPDLARFAEDAAKLLRPDGRMVIHMLNRFSLWEWLALVRRREWEAARRLGDCPRRNFTIGGLDVEHSLYYPLEAYRQCFAREFRLIRAYALGVLRPPHTVHQVPERVDRVLGWMDVKIGSHRPWLNRGRFFVLELVKRPADDCNR